MAAAMVLGLIGVGVITEAGDDKAPTTVTQVRLEPVASAIPSPSPSPQPSSPAAIPSRAAPTTDELVSGAQPGTALALLGTVTVKGRAAKTGYDRAAYGPAWSDTDRNGCDTRNDILARDLVDETFRGTRRCVVMSGRLAEPYTNVTITFTRADAQAVEIDHVVSLSNAWQTGAFAWVPAKRLAFANDPLNLLAVAQAANRQKADGDAATWLPPNKPYRCSMVARQVAVKAKYQLWLTPPERDAIARVLGSCPIFAAPTGGSPTLAPTAARPAAAQSPRPVQPLVGSPPASAATDYANCDEMHRDYPGGVARPGAVDQRANGGRARYRPHYDQALYDANTESDRDQDGIACEQ
ncbi:MAG TPA: DUF1524 domain-containing protein [Mycobacteriales bacterium]|nr:DUF1524 domain-containing protein [Mycobacteriales bacterium]